MIRTTAREFARFRPATIIHPGRRVNWNGDDTQRSRAVALLSALLGNWGRKGGLFLSAGIKVKPYPLPKYPKSDKPFADNPGGEKYPFADEQVTTGIREATITGKPYPIKGWFVYSTDLIHALPNQAETLKAIDALDLLVVIDTMPSEIAGYADVVLPEVTFLERHDELLTGYGRTGWMSLRQPVMPAPHDQKPGWWMAKELAGKLGIPECMPFKDMEEYLKVRVTSSGMDWEAVKKEGVVIGPKEPITVEDGLALTFDTPSGKVEFWSEQLKAKGFDPVPKFTRPAAGPEGALRLISGRRPCTPSAAREQSAAAGPDARERSLGAPGGRRQERPEKRAIREARQPGRHRQQPRARQGDAAVSAPTASTWSTASATGTRCASRLSRKARAPRS